MREDVAVLVIRDVVDHQLEGADLIPLKSDIDCRLVILILEEERITRLLLILAEVGFVSRLQQNGDRLTVEGEVGHQILHAELEEHLEEDSWRRLVSHERVYFVGVAAEIDRLDDKHLKQCRLIYLDRVNIVKLRELVRVLVSVLDANAPALVELVLEVDVVLRFDLEVVACAETVQLLRFALPVLDLAHLDVLVDVAVQAIGRLLLAEVDDIHSVFREDDEVPRRRQEVALDRQLVEMIALVLELDLQLDEIEDKHVVGVHALGLVTDDEVTSRFLLFIDLKLW